ncbi:hypothetical protein FHX82_002679 [Amycolatopsis bartoniae]|uniref:Uncharacterized protein n=1 Tax=Amycolatopsis bartoniae TaxID=941986 RepID=A0A8H9IX88_9PSEU|nr:hypothetical protein [Amycolatopsis bartoniae]MBB2935625.1 hypothetical protein [Amycolatopsis bartoniae]TVT02076.1 hypothetical protein FNH07_28035 [Amycolatopsis bartoniae]GHF60711.1 hypothetical protein GCM10017566_37540 [Amycolatopsis bartoniae]
MTKVTPDDLRVLLRSGEGSKLMLEAGQIILVQPEQAADHQGALTVASREDLRERLGSDEPDERTLQEQAEILSTEITNLGA